MLNQLVSINLLCGWIGMACGALSGALLGLFFHSDTWMGGYSSFKRRLLRLGHISFFGIGFINILFAWTTSILAFPSSSVSLASGSFLVALASMPLCCYLSAWRMNLKILFPIPVLGVLIGVSALLYSWPNP